MENIKPNKATIDLLIAELASKSGDVAIIVVANMKSNNPQSEEDTRHSLSTEFFAESEYEEIIAGFRTNGFYVEMFTNEMVFIHWVINGGMSKIHKKSIIVYNAANSGKGPGKKSLIPAFCNLNSIPIIGSNPYVVSLCRHKFHYGAILRQVGLPTPATWYYHSKNKWLLEKNPPDGLLVIAKPTYESGSVGIDESAVFYYSTKSERKIIEMANEFNQPITVQEFIPGYEVEVPLMIHDGVPHALQPVGLQIDNIQFLQNKLLTYEVVFDDNYKFFSFDALGSEFNDRLCQCAEDAVKAVGTEGFGRVDFRVTSEGAYYITDVSTYPHMVKHSTFWHMFQSMGYQYHQMFALLVALTLKKYKMM